MPRSALRSARTLAPSTRERLSGINGPLAVSAEISERKRSSQTFERRVGPGGQEHQPARVVLSRQQRRTTMRLATIGLATALALTTSLATPLAFAQTAGSTGAGATGGTATGGTTT